MSAPPLTIQLFGPLCVLVHGEPMPRVRTRSVEWLLALLVLRHGRTVDRSWLAGTLWLDSEEEQARHNLRDALMHLRRALGQEGARIQSPSRDTLTFDLSGAKVDVLRFDAAIQAGDEASLQSAVNLYTGVLLEGCYEEWVVRERESRQQACLQAQESLADAAEQCEDYTKALRLLRRMEGMDALRDTTRRALMRVLAASGDTPAALAAYREYRVLLREQMNVEPDPETVRLYQHIRKQAQQSASQSKAEGSLPSPPSAARGSTLPLSLAALPHPITALIGREQETVEIIAALSRSRLVTLVGGGGVGKTRLAIEVAGRRTAASAQEAAFIALAPLSDPALLPTFVANVLGIRKEAGTDPVSLLHALTDWLSTHEVLLVLDNCEHLIDAAASMAQNLLDRCPDLSILATSRQRLGVTGEVAWRVPSLPVPDEKQLPTSPLDANAAALAFPAIRLFVERASSAYREFQLTRREEVEAVCHICHRLDGIPLAIELAAARVGPLTLEDIHNRLDQRFRLLIGGSRTVLPRQQTLRSLIDWSYDLLNGAEKALLCRLSVFSGGWMLEAAEEVCTGDDVEDWEILDLLTSLVDKSLVVAETWGTHVRYRLLETVKQYGRDRLLESAGGKQWRERHQAYFLALAEEADPHLRGPEQQVWLERLEREHDNLRAAMEGEQTNVSLRIGVALRPFWSIRGYYSEGRARLLAALKQAGEGTDALTRAKALNSAGSLAGSQGDHLSARSLFEESLAIARELGDRNGIATSLTNLGNIAYALSDYAAARILYEESLKIARKGGHKKSIAHSLDDLGRTASVQGDYASAQSLLEESLTLHRELGDRQGAAVTLNNLGNIARCQSDYLSARSLLEESLVIEKVLGDRPGAANTLNLLGIVAHDQGDYASARPLLEESLAIARELGYKWCIANVLNQLGQIATDLGDYTSARLLLEEGLATVRELGNRRGITHLLMGLSDIDYWQGDYASARLLCEECLEIGRELEDRGGIAYSLFSLGNIAQSLCDYVSARSLYRESLMIRQELGDLRCIMEALEGFASLVAVQANPSHAAMLWGAAEQLREKLGTPLPPNERSRYETQVASVRAALTAESAFDAAWAEGRAMTLEQTLALAFEEKDA